MATATNDKPVRLGDLPVVKTNILENARQYDKGVVGGYNGTFPLTAASQGGIYLLPSTGKFYVCETAYNGAQISAPNSNFVELSVWKNHDRLTNLFRDIKYSERLNLFTIQANSIKNIYTVTHKGIHFFNFIYSQHGANGEDNLNIFINNNRKCYLNENGTADTKLISSSLILNLNIGDIVAIKTTNSLIDSSGAYSTVTVF